MAKYKVGQWVYTIDQKFQSKDITCTKCGHTKEVDDFMPYVSKVVIADIEVINDNTIYECVPENSDYEFFVAESSLFTTSKEAQAECDKRKKLKNRGGHHKRPPKGCYCCYCCDD